MQERYVCHWPSPSSGRQIHLHLHKRQKLKKTGTDVPAHAANCTKFEALFKGNLQWLCVLRYEFSCLKCLMLLLHYEYSCLKFLMLLLLCLLFHIFINLFYIQMCGFCVLVVFSLSWHPEPFLNNSWETQIIRPVIALFLIRYNRPIDRERNYSTATLNGKKHKQICPSPEAHSEATYT